MTDWQGDLVIRGMGEELLDRLPDDAIFGPQKADWGSRDETLAHEWSRRHSAFHGTVTWAPMIDPEWLKLESLKMVLGAKIELLLYSWVVAPLVEDGKAVGAILESKEGRVAVRAKAVVDTTGDGDMFVRAGEGYEGISTPTIFIIVPIRPRCSLASTSTNGSLGRTRIRTSTRIS